jgi:hypothetical protein
MKNNKTLRKFSKKNKKAIYKKNRKTFRNNRSLKGGFNSIQFAGALAICSMLEMNKIVLLPKPNTKSKRYEFIFDKDNKPNLSKDKFKVPGTSSYINISNFFIFVGSTDSNVLIKIDGNDSVVNRLANLTKNILKKDNAKRIVSACRSNGLLDDIDENELNNEIDETEGSIKQILNGHLNTSTDKENLNNALLNIIHLIMTILSMFFQLLFALLEKLPKSQTTQEEPIKSDALVVVESIEGSFNNAAENLNNSLNEIGKFEQYLDDGETVTPAAQNTFKCVMPYNKSTATNKDRFKSCNKVGTPVEKFKDATWQNLQNCVEQCHK